VERITEASTLSERQIGDRAILTNAGYKWPAGRQRRKGIADGTTSEIVAFVLRESKSHRSATCE